MSRSLADEASDYFNSLPIEERKKLAPLLEDYRRMGIEEGRREFASAMRRLAARSRSIEVAALSTQRQYEASPAGTDDYARRALPDATSRTEATG